MVAVQTLLHKNNSFRAISLDLIASPPQIHYRKTLHIPMSGIRMLNANASMTHSAAVRCGSDFVCLKLLPRAGRPRNLALLSHTRLKSPSEENMDATVDGS